MTIRNKVFDISLFKHTGFIWFAIELDFLFKNEYSCHSQIVLSFWKYQLKAGIVYWRSHIGKINSYK